MNDPAAIDLGNAAIHILADIFVGSLAGWGTAFLWFRNSKEKLYQEIVETKEEFEKREQHLQQDYDRRADKIERQLADLWTMVNQNALNVGIIATKQSTVLETLDQFRLEGRETSHKIDEIIRTCLPLRKE